MARVVSVCTVMLTLACGLFAQERQKESVSETTPQAPAFDEATQKRFSEWLIERFYSKAQLEGRWLCVSEQTTGFIHEFGEWRTANLNKTPSKVIFTRSSDGVVKATEDDVEFSCGESYFSSSYTCEGVGMQVYKFNPSTKWFISVFLAGYIEEDGDLFDKRGHTPFIQIGTCQSF